MRVLPISYPYGGTFVNDYFGEHLDARKSDQNTVYAGAFARELQALVEQEQNPLVAELSELVEDSVEIRQFIESQTRSRRSVGTRWSA